MPEITLVITSCGRHDLLERTLRSFDHFNTYPIKETIIIEDSDLNAPEWLGDLAHIGPKKWISNGKRKAQIYSCDRAMAEVQTEYLFWCEDDWEFTRAGFMEESLAILEQNPNVAYVCVRSESNHPAISDPRFPYQILQPDWEGGWGHFAFNPGLRRLSDYQRIGSYGRHVGYETRFCGEMELSQLYREMGFYVARIAGACHHIGEGNRHVPWETAPKNQKVLIAVPACHMYQYGQWHDQKIDHVDKVSNARVEGIRATWQKDVRAFSRYVDMKFFYGNPPNGNDELLHGRKPDEIFLNVPDDYAHLPQKVQAIYRWALAHGYDYVFKADDDTFIYLDRLMSSGFERHDYIGYCSPDEQRNRERYASGGPGYWISKIAMELAVAATVDDWAEDRWVGKVLRTKGIMPVRDVRYLPGFGEHYAQLNDLPNPHDYISFHACTPEMMKELHGRVVNPTFRLLGHALNEPEVASDSPSNIRPAERITHIPAMQKRALVQGNRILVAILACHHRQILPNVQRRTWLRDLVMEGVDYKFFLGRQGNVKPFDPRRPAGEKPVDVTRKPEADEIFLPVPDEYNSLPLKTQAMLQWAYDHGYDYVFKCDDDTTVIVQRLLACDFYKHEFSGFCRTSPEDVVYAQGGAGYWISRKAIEIFLRDFGAAMHAAEDINLAMILDGNNIFPQHDHRFQPAMANPPYPDNDIITCHQCTAQEMEDIYKRFQQEPSVSRGKPLSSELSDSRTERVGAC